MHPYYIVSKESYTEPKTAWGEDGCQGWPAQILVNDLISVNKPL